MENKVGEYKIYANLVDIQTYQQAANDNKTALHELYPTASKKMFESNNPFYFL